MRGKGRHVRLDKKERTWSKYKYQADSLNSLLLHQLVTNEIVGILAVDDSNSILSELFV